MLQYPIVINKSKGSYHILYKEDDFLKILFSGFLWMEIAFADQPSL